MARDDLLQLKRDLRLQLSAAAEEAAALEARLAHSTRVLADVQAQLAPHAATLALAGRAQRSGRLMARLAALDSGSEDEELGERAAGAPAAGRAAGGSGAGGLDARRLERARELAAPAPLEGLSEAQLEAMRAELGTLIHAVQAALDAFHDVDSR